MRATILCLVMAAAAATGCSSPTIRNCALDETYVDDGHGLSYSAVMPSDCPVPLGAKGEQKFIGANITDGGAHDYAFTTLVVRNYRSNEVGSDRQVFIPNISGVWHAQPRADFPAATSFNGTIANGVQLSIEGRDCGKFLAVLTSGSLGAAGRLCINYIGSNVVASIIGPDVPTSGSTGSWSGSVSGGSAPYSYAWYRNGDLVSTSSTYSANVGSAEFGLRLVVTDQTASVRWTDYWVDVDGVRGSVTGPTLVYYSEGNATWNLDVRGGYSPYSADWYFVDSDGIVTSAGSGTSLSTYPPHAGDFQLIATVTDSHGVSTTASTFFIVAIGDGNGGCTPVPPQITCDP